MKTVHFEHAFFATNADGYFRLDEGNRRPVYVINLGDQTGVVPVNAIRQEIGQADRAGQSMLDHVVEALKYVRNIRVGDALPSEIVSGQASWQPEERHRRTANRRIVASMVRWSGEWDGPVIKTRDLRQFLAEQVDQHKLARALDKLERSLADTGDEQADVQPILNKLTDELSYIEALRETVEHIRRIGNILDHLRRAGRGQANDVHEIAAVLRVFNNMMLQFDEKLQCVDQAIVELHNSILDHDAVCARMRQVRDELRLELFAWDGPLEQWNKITPRNFDPVAVASMIGDLYRFLAPLYAPVDQWSLMDNCREVVASKAGA